MITDRDRQDTSSCLSWPFRGVIKNKSEFSQIHSKLLTQEGVAPTVERWTPNPTVAGSNPVGLIFINTLGCSPHNYYIILKKLLLKSANE